MNKKKENDCVVLVRLEPTCVRTDTPQTRSMLIKPMCTRERTPTARERKRTGKVSGVCAYMNGFKFGVRLNKLTFDVIIFLQFNYYN